MYCVRCGKELQSGVRFCSFCGAEQVAGGQVPPASTNFDGLMRPRAGRMVAGVCAGLALRYGWDVALVRVVLICIVLLAGTGILAYIVLWIALPEEPYLLPNGGGTAPPV